MVRRTRAYWTALRCTQNRDSLITDQSKRISLHPGLIIPECIGEIDLIVERITIDKDAMNETKCEKTPSWMTNGIAQCRITSDADRYGILERRNYAEKH